MKLLKTRCTDKIDREHMLDELMFFIIHGRKISG